MSRELETGLKRIAVNYHLPGGGRKKVNDTIPMEAHSTIFIVINFDAQEQLGRYVYHCHILEHEDQGLMAPMEVIR